MNVRRFAAAVSVTMLGSSVLAQSAQDVLPAYIKMDTREATREATLKAMGAANAGWGRWFAIGPFDHTTGTKDLATAYAPEASLSAGGEIDVHAPVDLGGGQMLEWKEAEESQPIGDVAGVKRVDLHTVLSVPGRHNAAAYAYRTIETGGPVEIPVTLGSDDGSKVWLNGVVVHEAAAERPFAPDSDHFTLKLRKGVNHLLVKITQGNGEWQFALAPLVEIDPAMEALLDYQLDSDFPDAETRYYRLVTIPTPKGVVAEVGGLDVIRTKDARPILSTRRGDVYIIENAFAMPPVGARWRLFASGLAEPLGVVVRPGASPAEKLVVYTAQRPELTRLVETSGDTQADVFETASSEWKISGNYHEYAFGPKFDREGNAYVTLNLAHTGGETTMGAPVPTRGTAMKITTDGRAEVIADGLRSPDGLGMWTDGEMFYTDNQGDYVATNKISHLARGSFHGHQSTLQHREGWGKNWRQSGKKVPPITQAAVWFPYKTMGQSTSDIEVDTTAGKFGPFAGQFFAGEQTLCTIARVDMEKFERDGQPIYQGVCIPFRAGFMSGVHRLAFAPDGSLFVGMTDRGWGSTGPKRFGLQRLVWTGVTPFEIRTVRARPGGFLIEYTLDVPPEAAEASKYRVTSWTYEYHPDYGSPETDSRPQRVTAARIVGPRSVAIDVDRLRTGPLGFVHDITIAPMSSAPTADGTREPLLHASAYYTLHVIPTKEPVAGK